MATYMEKKAQELELAEQEGAATAQQLWDNATPEEREQVIKLAHVHDIALSQFATEEEKQAYAEGAQGAAAMSEAGMMGPNVPPDAGAGDEQITDEDIMAILAQMVQSGELPPELAEQILQQLQGGGGAPAAGPEGAAPGVGAPPPEAAGAAPAEAPSEPSGPPEEKEARTLFKQASSWADELLKKAA